MRLVEITSDDFTIGRGKDTDLLVDNKAVSQINTRILKESGAYYVVDQASANGTRMNGERITRQRLYEGSVFSIMDHVYKFRKKDAKVYLELSTKTDQESEVKELAKESPAQPLKVSQEESEALIDPKELASSKKAKANPPKRKDGKVEKSTQGLSKTKKKSFLKVSRLAKAVMTKLRSKKSEKNPRALITSTLTHIVLIGLLVYLISGDKRRPLAQQVTISLAPPAKAEVAPQIMPSNPPPPPVDFAKVENDAATGAEDQSASIDKLSEVIFEELELAPEVSELDLEPTLETSNFGSFGEVAKVGGLASLRGQRGKSQALAKYRGTKRGQVSLVKALNWLKQQQRPDGSWGETRHAAYTGLACLSFLAYGVTNQHKSYGHTLRKGLKKLDELMLANFRGFKGTGYDYAIGAFALAEATSLMPEEKIYGQAMERSMEVILNGQNRDGGFDYDYNGLGTSVLTLTGWNVLAIKAARRAQCKNPALGSVSYRISDFVKSLRVERSFAYVPSGDSGNSTRSGIGVLSLQTLGEGQSTESKEVLASLSNRSYVQNDFYNNYYLTQVMFNRGGSHWSQWAQKFQQDLIQREHIGGGWENEGGWLNLEKDRLLGTSLGCLMLAVFYRYPPTHLKDKLKEIVYREEEVDLFD